MCIYIYTYIYTYIYIYIYIYIHIYVHIYIYILYVIICWLFYSVRSTSLTMPWISRSTTPSPLRAPENSSIRGRARLMGCPAKKSWTLASSLGLNTQEVCFKKNEWFEWIRLSMGILTESTAAVMDWTGISSMTYCHDAYSSQIDSSW